MAQSKLYDVNGTKYTYLSYGLVSGITLYVKQGATAKHLQKLEKNRDQNYLFRSIYNRIKTLLTTPINSIQKFARIAPGLTENVASFTLRTA